MAIINNYPHTFTNGTTMEAAEMNENFAHAQGEINAKAPTSEDLVVDALPFPELIDDEVTDANKIMANFEFIRSQVNANALIDDPSSQIGEYPHNIQNNQVNDADQVNENFTHLQDGVNALDKFFVALEKGNQWYKSSDGLSWSTGFLSPTSNYEILGFNGNRFLSVGNNQECVYSDDGESWNSVSYPGSSNTAKAIAWNGSTWVILHDSSSNNVVTADGQSFTSYNNMPGTNRRWRGVCWDGTQFIAITGATDSGLSARSPDGITWNSAGMPGGSYNTIKSNGVITLAISNNRNDFAYTYNGISWFTGSLPSTQSWIGLEWNGSIWVMISSSGQAAVSSDGLSWTQYAMPGVFWIDIAWNGSDFCAIKTNDNESATTKDGITWQIGNLGDSNGREAVTSNLLPIDVF